MNKKILLIVIPFLLNACKKENEETTTSSPAIENAVETTQEPAKDSVVATPNQPAAAVANPNETPLEKIDRENNLIIKNDNGAIQKASIDPRDSSIWIVANMKEDHRIFGYEKPATDSKKMLLLSVFTNDVEKNPFQLPYGAFYGTDGMVNMRLKFNAYQGKFIKAELIKENQKQIIYFEKKWMEFE